VCWSLQPGYSWQVAGRFYQPLAFGATLWSDAVMQYSRIFWILFGLLALGMGPEAAQAASGVEPRLGRFYETWLTAVEHRMLDAEREAFAGLTNDVEREVFIRRFWQARSAVDGAEYGTELGTADHELDAARWQYRFEEARQRFDSLADRRAQALLVAGKPLATTVFGGCVDLIRPLEIWSYEHLASADRGEKEDEGFFLVFFRHGEEHRHWAPSEGTDSLLHGYGENGRTVSELVDYATRRGCLRARFGASLDLGRALEGALGFEELRQRMNPPPPDLAWLAAFEAERTAGGLRLPAPSARLDLPGRYGQKIILRGQVEVPVAEVGKNAEGHLFDRVTIQGDLWLGRLGGRLVDAFQITHYVAGPPPSGVRIPLEFYRRLRPGDYVLDLRVADSKGLALLRETRHLEVPHLNPETKAEAPAGYRLGFSGLTRSEVGVLTTFPSVELRPLEGDDLPVGEVTLEATTTGGPIARVDFLLDGELAGSDPNPPWAVDLHFTPPPRPHRVEAIAFDPEGRQLDRHSLAFRAAPDRFAVRLIKPVRGTAGRRAVVAVDVPENDALERLEIYLGERLLAALEDPPFEVDLPARSSGGSQRDLRIVRAVAILESGATAEDLVLIDTRAPVDEIDVQLVELYTTVLNAQGLPITGLGSADFRVLEDSVEQPLERFDTVQNLAINVALLMDVSSSMRRRVEIASRSARRFFDTVLTPKDRASLQVFNHTMRRPVPFTADVALLHAEAAGFRAWGTTRLHDSLVYTVHSFGGLEGKRALVLLSDGQDVDSDFPFEQVLQHTLRAGVAVYPIVLGVEDTQTLTDLETLARETGGRHFVISTVSELDRVYRRIEEELRSQYLLVYRSPAKKARGEIRTVQVEVLRAGLRARTLHGYYP